MVTWITNWLLLTCLSACNVVLQKPQGVYTLRNFGDRKNCTASIIFPESFKILSATVGPGTLANAAEHNLVETGLIRQVSNYLYTEHHHLLHYYHHHHQHVHSLPVRVMFLFFSSSARIMSLPFRVTLFLFTSSDVSEMKRKIPLVKQPTLFVCVWASCSITHSSFFILVIVSRWRCEWFRWNQGRRWIRSCSHGNRRWLLWNRFNAL